MYDYLPGDSPTIFFLPALNQTRHGTKASQIKTWCRRTGRSFLVADYYGMGKSSGDYKEATISRWASDTAKLVDWLKTEHAQEKVVLVGAGVGGWVMLHAAKGQKNPRRPIVGCVGIAADPDFTETLIWPALDDATREKVMKEGLVEIEWGGKPYTITKSLIEDGKKMLLLDKGSSSVSVGCPVRLIQGLGDEEIPSEIALKLSDALEAKDVVITYVKYGKHSLEDNEDDFKRIYFAIEDIERSDAKANFFRSLNRPV